MSRLALISLVVALGCKPSPPMPASMRPAPVTTWVIPGKEGTANSTRFDFQGDLPGVMTIAEFKAKHEGVDETRSSARTFGIRRFRRANLDGVAFEGVPVVEAHYEFIDGVLKSVELKLKNDPDHLVPTALLTRYGPSDNSNVASYEHCWKTPTSILFCVLGEFPSVVMADSALSEKTGKRRLEKRVAPAQKDL